MHVPSVISMTSVTSTYLVESFNFVNIDIQLLIHHMGILLENKDEYISFSTENF